MRSSNGLRPIVALDIDGTLGDYHGHFLVFAEQWSGRKMPDASSINPGLPLHRHMAMSKRTYRECKLAYRQGGLKRSMPAYPNARKLTISARRAGAEVWLCTTRPYLRLDNIDPDTRHWLRRNRIQYDGVLFGEHKYRDLAKHRRPGQEVVYVLDDLDEMVDQALSLGFPAALRDQPYNRYTRERTYPRVRDLFQAEQEVHSAIKNFKRRNRNDQ